MYIEGMDSVMGDLNAAGKSLILVAMDAYTLQEVPF